jgi:hypothetical protein
MDFCHNFDGKNGLRVGMSKVHSGNYRYGKRLYELARGIDDNPVVPTYQWSERLKGLAIG